QGGGACILQGHLRIFRHNAHHGLTQKKEKAGAHKAPPLCFRSEARQSISRVLYKTAIFLGWASPHSSSRLGGARKGTHCPGRALLPVRFTEPRKLPSALVRSYRTFPPLPAGAGGF